MNWTRLIFSILGILGIVAILGYLASTKELERKEKEIQDTYKLYADSIRQYQRDLIREQRTSDSLVHRITSIDSLSKNLSRRIADQGRELKEIKGRYNNKTSKELETLMIERWKSAN